MIATPSPLTTETSRVLIIEHQTLFAKALCKVLASDPALTIVGDAGAVDAVMLRQAKPALILLDVDAPEMDVEATIGLCRAHAREAHVCVLSTRAEPILMRRCLQAGAGGYVLKDVSLAELGRAIRLVASGASYADPRIAGTLLRRRSAGVRSVAVDDLSDREIAILRTVAEGLSNKEISARLQLSEKTVKNHLSRIFSKLGLISRSQAAVYAIKHGLI